MKYQPLMRRFLLTELYADSLKPEGNLEEMVVQVQWIAMEYATIRHAVFLHWLLSQGEGSFCEEGISTSCRRGISYEDVRDYMVVVSRMTGSDRVLCCNCCGIYADPGSDCHHEIIDGNYSAGTGRSSICSNRRTCAGDKEWRRR